MSKKMLQHVVTVNSADFQIRYETLEGRRHMVVPVVMLKEGAFSGSAGSYFYTMEELEKSKDAWNGRPVVVFHPQKDGMFVSANNPDINNEYSVGRVFNTKIKNKSLVAELWIDESRADLVSPGLRQQILLKSEIDVSTGLVAYDDGVNGVYNDSEYVGTVYDIIPDHLAILPGGRGACSWEDGCGIRANKSVHHNELGVDDIISQINTLLSNNVCGDIGAGVTESYAYVVELFQSYFIYQQETQEKTVLLKRSYEIGSDVNKDNVVKLFDDIVEVRREVRYIEVTNPGKVDFPEQEMEGDSMTVKETETVEEPNDRQKVEIEVSVKKVDNEESETDATTTVESDVVPETEEEGCKDCDSPIVDNSADCETVDCYVQKAIPKFRGVLNEALSLYNEKKNGLVNRIMSHKNNAFTKAALVNKDMNELELIGNLCVETPEVSFEAKAGTTEITNEVGVKPMQAPKGLV